ncbi:MAG: mechanosensitive ion channel family protein [Myxococcota bacterium]|nr:mechanosensitive ion channel family protein [Myxococcota bacterium]
MSLETVKSLFEELIASSWFRASGILILSVFVGAFVDIFASKFLQKWASLTKSNLDDQIIKKFQKPLVWTVILVGGLFALEQLDIEDSSRSALRRLIGSIVTVLWFSFFLQMNHILLEAARNHKTRFSFIQPATFPLFENLGKLIIFLGGVYAFIEVWNFDATGWLASAGVVGIAVGFAARDTLANLFAGVFIIADAPYRVGDFVVLGDQHRGMVRHIGLRSTRILTRDDIEITVPNSVIAAGMIVNETRGVDRIRCRVPVGVAYGSDIDLVRSVLIDVAKQEPLVANEPIPEMRFRAFGDSSLDCELLCWIAKPAELGLAVDRLNTSIYKAFADNSIEIPFPQRDLHVRSISGLSEELNSDSKN